MNWKQLISNKRFGMEELHEARKDDRSEFQRDYDRLIFSAPFRRLQNKTQVFPLPGSVFVHNRLTHSLEVSCVGFFRKRCRQPASEKAPRLGRLPYIGNRFYRFSRMSGTRSGKPTFRPFGRKSHFNLLLGRTRNGIEKRTFTDGMG